MWTCVYCQADVEDAEEVCWNCGSRHEDQIEKPVLQQVPTEESSLETLPLYPCMRCGSTNLMPRGVLRSRADLFTDFLPVILTMKDNFWGSVFDGNHQVALVIVVCGECGLCTLEARNARELWAKYAQWLAKQNPETE